MCLNFWYPLVLSISNSEVSLTDSFKDVVIYIGPTLDRRDWNPRGYAQVLFEICTMDGVRVN